MQRRLLFVLTFLLVTHGLWAQDVTLSGTTYTQTFDGIASGLPTGWYAYTGATSSTLGASVTPALSSTTSWATVTGNFRNVASADGLTQSSSTGAQGVSTDRALAVRQTGAFGDPGAAFAVKLTNTTGLQDFKLSLKLQSLDVTSTRTTTWSIQYAIGNAPTSFTTVATQDIGGATFSNNPVNYEFDLALDNIADFVWIRVVALTASTGSGNRPTTGLDDFTLTYSSLNSDPRLGVLPKSLSGMYYTGTGPSASKSFVASGKNLTNSVSIAPPANFEVSTDNSAFSTSPISVNPAGDGSLNQTIYTRLATGASTGAYSGSITVSSSGVATSKTVAVSGTVFPAGDTGPCGTSTQISAIRGATDGITFTATGRVTSILGTNIYIQDATGGIMLYTGTGTTIELPELSIGDEIQVTGVLATYQTDKELKDFTGCFVKTSATNAPVTPVAVTASTLCDHKGELVTLTGITSFSPAGATFTGNTNYTLTTGSGTVVMRIQNGTDLVAATRPSGTVDITGVVSLFNGVCQLLPRSTADVPGSTPNTASCPGVGTGGAGISTDNTLDITWWNVEWLGNTGFGPTNEAQQQDNVRQQLQNMNQDIYCLEEVTDLTKLDAIVATLNANTGKSYTYTCGADPTRNPPIYYSHWFDDPEVSGDATTYGQKVCFVYNTAVVSNVSASQILTEGAGTSAWASNRFPLLMNCDVTINGVTKNFKLVGVHAKSGSDVSSYNRRITDYTSLKTYLDNTYPTSNVMIMGDFNDDADQSIYVDAATSSTAVSSFNNFVTSADYTTITKQLSTCNISSTASYPDIIDHLVVSNEISTNGSFPASGIAYIPNSVTAVRPIVGGTTTSDHFPVMARFQFASPLSATLVASTSAVCSGQPVNLIVTVNGLSSGDTYSYTVTNGTNSTTTSGVSTSSTFASVVPTVAGSFTLTVFSSASASATAISGNVAIDSPISVVAGASSATTAIGGTVSLTASGASTYQWSAPAGATLDATTGSPVSATLTSVGVQTFTLLASQGSCTQTALVSVTATNGPDISPTLVLPQSNFTASAPDNVRSFVVNLFEVGYHSTSMGQVTITISAPTGYSLTFNGAQTSIDVSGGDSNVSVDNQNWDVTSNLDGQQITLKMKAGQFMDANTQRNVGFSLTRTTANSGSTSNITVNVTDDGGSGYDINAGNNVYARIISGL
ncbi:DUF5689 domain-containing protein [Spirosoma gilvum]